MVIGEVEEGIWMEKDGERRQVEARGYEHRIGGGKCEVMIGGWLEAQPYCGFIRIFDCSSIPGCQNA
jgi:hypothetical protein